MNARSASIPLDALSPDVLALNPELSRAAKRRARARLEKLSLTPEFRSKLEKRAWEQWVPTQSASVVKYEPLVFHLAGGNYTPDFMLAFDDGSLWFVEVKGNWKAYQSGRSSKHLLKQASVEFGFLGRWFALLPVPAKDGGGWHLEEYR